jgi:hypothetical protein
VTRTCAHTGFLHAQDALIHPTAIRGTIESELDGHHLTLKPTM